MGLLQRGCSLGDSSSCDAQREFPDFDRERQQEAARCERGSYACRYPGTRYKDGFMLGLGKDPVEALRLFKLGCDSGPGDAEACLEWAHAHLIGNGVAQDVSYALTFLDKICNSNNLLADDAAPACDRLSWYYKDGKHVSQDLAASKRYDQRACQLDREHCPDE
jgi:TPR repeat protein